MERLNLIEIETRWGYRTFELYHGDITQLDEPVDLLVISALPNNYDPIPNTVVWALQERRSIIVGELAQHPEFDFRHIFGCWVARLSHEPMYQRLLCIESSVRTQIFANALRNIPVVLAMLEALDIPTHSLALPLLGAGNQAIAPELVMQPMLDATRKSLSRLQYLEKIVFVEYNVHRAQSLNEAMNTVLGRARVTLSHGVLVDGIRRDIATKIGHALPLAAAESNRCLHDLRRIVASEMCQGFELGIAARRLVEFLVNDLMADQKRSELYKRIDELGQLGIADWIRSYMHVLRIFGNESAHQRQRAGRVPISIDEPDLAVCLFCILRLLEFWITFKTTHAPAHPSDSASLTSSEAIDESSLE